MKKTHIYFAIGLVVALVTIGYFTMESREQTSTPFRYTLKGILPNSAFDGQQFPIKKWKKVVGQITIQGNQFEYHGEADSAMYCLLDVGTETASFIIKKVL